LQVSAAGKLKLCIHDLWGYLRMPAASSETERLMLLIDGSAESRGAVDYVARIIGRRRGFQVYFLYILPSLPPELLEFGGAEDRRKER